MAKWPPPVVEIEWLDSIRYDSWDTLEERLSQLEEKDGLLHRSCGYLIASRKQYVAVVLSVGIGTKNVHSTIQIPRRAVIKMRVIKEAKDG